MEWLDKLIRSQAKLQTEGYIGERGPAAPDNEAYLTIDVETLWITHVRKGLGKFYGAIHGSVIIGHESDGKQEFQAFSSVADAKELDANHLDRIVQGPYRLLDSVPYRGGGVDVRISLLSIKSADLAAPYINLLKSISDAAGVTFVSTAAPLVDVIHDGIAALVGDNSLEIGRYGLFDPVYTGYYAVVRAEPGELPIDRLAFDAQSRRIVLDGQAVTDYPYFVLKISTSGSRHNWYDIPDIKTAFSKMKEQFRASPGDTEKNLQAFDAFQVAVELSPDLLNRHALNLIEDARKKYSRYITGEQMPSKGRMELPDMSLQDLQPFI
jgi:hypothetical protein